MTQSGATVLENRLVLHRFVCQEFGYDDLGAMLDQLNQVRPELGFIGESDYVQALRLHSKRAKIRVGPMELAEYDRNIATHSRELRITLEHGRTWKPHQYLALLFTEHYLSRYFDDPEALRNDLNDKKSSHRLTSLMPDYEPNDLRTLAFQSATGSGKTLLMHTHILQYRHYLARAGGRLNNVVLVTPNEQMSSQHQREMQSSGIPARLFSIEAGSELFSPVEIIDVNKLAEKQGVKRVAVADFGDDNLVLVDEGHLGTSGKVWRERRRELGTGGFTFEYSATFNQVVNKKEADLLNAYGRCLLFDYSYRRFYEDGYGKDSVILNLPGGAEDENSDMYLLGCLLTFFQQCQIWENNARVWEAYNPAKPLWVFLGKTVTGSSRADKATRSDVIQIVDFLGRVLAHRDQVLPMIELLLAGQSGLLDDAGGDFFRGRFSHLKQGRPEALYADLCETVFNGSGRLHVAYLTQGEGELHLRTTDNEPFGVINVGDSASLYKLLSERPDSDFDVRKEMGFEARLFADVDRPDSTVNVVIGARRFIAGWNSWRVSTMGLMHVGVGEGPEIIQMFGRGIRLRGRNMSLKRHRETDTDFPPLSDQLLELEKLYIFGLRANYMQTFRDLLRMGGVRIEQDTFTLPVTWNFAQTSDLKLIRLKQGRKYDVCKERPVLPAPNGEDRPAIVTLDLYSRLQSITSQDGSNGANMDKITFGRLPDYAAFFDIVRILDRLLSRKQQKGWSNLVIERETVEQLLQSKNWYELYLPPDRQDIFGFDQVRALEDIAVELITEYADRFWRKKRRNWEHDQIEVMTLGEDDPNRIHDYKLSVDATKDQLVEEAVALARTLKENDPDNLKAWYEHLEIGTIQVSSHAYQPLLYAKETRVIAIQPVPINESEKRVVEDLAGLAERDDPCLQGKELFVIRNLTGGRGVSFFDDFGYYPDFIVWLRDESSQHVLFLDPKGLARFGRKERRKVKLHHEIAETGNRVRTEDPNLELHAYVLSVTPASEIDDGNRTLEQWKRDGVYFLNDPDCLQQVIKHALTRTK